MTGLVEFPWELMPPADCLISDGVGLATWYARLELAGLKIWFVDPIIGCMRPWNEFTLKELEERAPFSQKLKREIGTRYLEHIAISQNGFSQ